LRRRIIEHCWIGESEAKPHPPKKEHEKIFTPRMIGRSLNHKFHNLSTSILLILVFFVLPYSIKFCLELWKTSKTGIWHCFQREEPPFILFFTSGWEFWMYSLFKGPLLGTQKSTIKNINTCWDCFKVLSVGTAKLRQGHGTLSFMDFLV
jgi:hypothetical protein